MTAAERREKIQELLAGAQGPLSASLLAAQLGVSRQIVVGDIALLRAAGHPIDATPRGYVKHLNEQQGFRGMLACCHEGEARLREELYCMVDNGGVIEDVIVENPLYGEITGQLQIASRYDAEAFLTRVREEPNSLLSRLTGGVHLHTLSCPDRETFERIRRALQEKGLLYEK